jgi:hypothetical protein
MTACQQIRPNSQVEAKLPKPLVLFLLSKPELIECIISWEAPFFFFNLSAINLRMETCMRDANVAMQGFQVCVTLRYA